MALRIAIVGPGRVGLAFARCFVPAGVHVLGFVGRDRARTESRIQGLGDAGASLEVLSWEQAHAAHVLIFAVGDEQLPAAIEAAAAAGRRPCSLWLHTSGRHGLDVFDDALQASKGDSVRVGALHPLLPFSEATPAISGALALLLGEPRSMRFLHRLCAKLQLQPIVCAANDGRDGSSSASRHNRPLYHAACALAANGATALFGLAGQLMQRAGGIQEPDGHRIVASLMQAAITASAEHGPGPALSGPVRRGDAETVTAHLDALQAEVPSAIPAYAALMQEALRLARDQGLPPPDCERIASALSLLRPPS